MFASKKRVIGAALAVALGLSGSLSTAPAFAEDKVITIWADDTRGPNLIKAIGELKDQKVGTWAPGYKVEVKTYSTLDALKEAFTNSTATTGPDILMGANDWVAPFAKSGKLAPYAMSTALKSQFSATALGDLTFRGKLYGVPMDVNNVAMIYNDRLVTSAPRSFGDMVAVYNQLKTTKKLSSGLCVAGGGMAFGGQIVLSALGGGPYAVRNGKVQVNSDPFNPTTLANNIKRYLLKENGKGNGFFPGTDTGCKTNFLAGKVPYAVIGNWEWRDYQAKGFKMSTMMAVPGVTPGTYGASFGSVSGAFLTAYAKTNGRESGAKTVLTKLFASKDGQLKYQKQENRPPANLQAALSASVGAKGFARAASQASIPLVAPIITSTAGGATYWDATPAFWSNVLVDGKNVNTQATKLAGIFKKNIAAGK